MLHNKLTTNELAKLEVYNRFLDARYGGEKAVDKEAEAPENAVDKHTWWMFKHLHMDKIYDKLES